MPCLPLGRIGDGKHERDVGVHAGGHEHLGAVEHIASVAMFGAGEDIAGIRSALRLGQAEGAEHFAARHRAEEFLLLLRRAVLDQRHAADRIVAAHDGGDGAVAGRDLLEGDRIGDVVEGGAAVFGRNRHAHEAELAQLGDRLARELGGAIPLRRMRCQPARARSRARCRGCVAAPRSRSCATSARHCATERAFIHHEHAAA